MVTAFKKTPGVKDATADYATSTARVTYDSKRCTVDDLVHSLDGTKYKAFLAQKQ